MAIAELVVKLIGDISGFSRSMSQVGRDLKKQSKNITEAGKSLSTGVSLPLAGIGIAALAMAGDFESSMSKVSALGGITGGDLEKLKLQAIDLGAKTQFSAKQAADGMGEFAAAGFSASQISQAMSGTLDLAAAAQISVGDAAQITVATLGQFNLKASDSGHVADVLAKASAEGAVTITELADSMKYVGPVAQSVGISLEDTSAALAALSNSGIKGEQAGTSLRMGLLRMVKPTAEAQGAIEKYGLSLTDASGHVKPFTEVIGQLEAKQVSLADLTRIVGVNSVSAWAALQTKGGASLQDFTNRVNDNKDAAANMAAVLRDNLKGSFEQMGGSVETLGIVLGQILTPAARAFMGVVEDLANKGTELLIWFKTLNPNIQNAVIAFGLIVGVAGPIVLVIGKIGLAVAALIKTFAAANVAVSLFTSVTGIGLIVIALGLATAAIVYFKDDIGKVFVEAAKIVAGFYDSFMTVLNRVVASVWPTIGPIVDLFSRLVSEIGTVLKEVVTTATDLFTEILNIASNIMVSIIETIATGLDKAANLVVFLVKAFSLGFGAVFDAAVDLTKEVLNIFVQLFTGLTTTVSEGLGIILGYFGVTGNDILKFWNETLGKVKQVFLDVFDAIVKGLGYVQDVVGTFSDSAAGAIGNLKKSMEDLRKPTEATTVEIKKTEAAVTDLSKASETNKKIISDLTAQKHTDTKATQENKKAIDEVLKSTNKGTEGTENHTKATHKKTEAEKEAEKAEKEHAKSLEEFAKKLSDTVKGSEEYEKLLKGMADGSISAADGADRLKKLYEEARIKLTEYNGAMAEYTNMTLGMANGENIPAEKIAEITKKANDATVALDKLSGKKLKAPEVGEFDLSGLSNQIGEKLGSAISDALQGKKGADFQTSIAALGQDIGSELGTAAGAAIGGPLGAALGKVLGKVAGDEIQRNIANFGKTGRESLRGALNAMFGLGVGTTVDKLFGDKLFGDSAGTTARKTVDKFFADALDGKRIQLVIDGQLKEIKDIDFGGSMFGTSGGSAAQFFNGMEASAQEAFSGIGSAFAELSGVGSQYSQAIAMALAENVGGSLNNLQVMLGGMGLSFEDLKKKVVESFLSSQLSFVEAKKALDAISQVAQKGIPDAVGATVQAFENLKNAGIKGGRYATDAIRDIADEAKELNIKTFPALMANLIGSGRLTKDEVDKLMKALSDNGIKSVQALSSATDEQLIPVLAQLQNQKFPFSEAANDAKDLTKAIANMPDKKDVTINVKTNLDDNTKKALDGGLLSNGNQTLNRSGITQNAKGNVFSAGAIMPFAKGGVVKDFTMFDMGSMAERGAEAIMPLKRLSNGDLGISATGGGGGGDSYHIEINAPYAQPGAAETIRREIDKYFDIRNRKPGIR